MSHSSSGRQDDRLSCTLGVLVDVPGSACVTLAILVSPSACRDKGFSVLRGLGAGRYLLMKVLPMCVSMCAESPSSSATQLSTRPLECRWVPTTRKQEGSSSQRDWPCATSAFE
jgi:hypothetical protein